MMLQEAGFWSGNTQAPGRLYGAVVGIVSNNVDPDGMGRVKVTFPWLSAEDESGWVRIATPMAGAGRGVWMLPEVGDEVLLMFANGNIDQPYVVGALWNGVDAPPDNNDDGRNNRRVICSRSGHTLVFDDTEGAETITISGAAQKNKIVIDASGESISIESSGRINLSAAGGSICRATVILRSNAQHFRCRRKSPTR
ncbi:phage baseplate assembly protein V [Microbulbifer taiwanensis]|uniref:phage baseplate assembly protein V n=1 Tax=Microbulbifer taiwanensis TaxID=986746 RepID=UPI00360DA93C